jgi:hypothetical protein
MITKGSDNELKVKDGLMQAPCSIPDEMFYCHLPGSSEEGDGKIFG